MRTIAAGLKKPGAGGVLAFMLLWAALSPEKLRCEGIIQRSQDSAIAEKQAAIDAAGERFIPLRFRIGSRENEKLTVEFRFYSMLTSGPGGISREDQADSREIPGSRSFFEMEGAELFIDVLRVRDAKRVFLIIPFGEINWVFPHKIFTNYMKPDEGLPIFSCYDRDGFPAIYEGFSGGSLNRELLSRAFADLKANGRITSRDLRNRVTGNAVHDIAKFARYKTGAWYSLTVNLKNGAMEIIEEGF
ncbi:MAG: hypothetical protein LBK27_02505 [Treponema sp.]|jgi:hypothetical protein|nr:hypothetical protein [Treponema sp.]